MAKKLTMKEKIMHSFLFAQQVKNIAKRLEYYSKDLQFDDGLTVSKDITNLCNEFLEKIK